MALGNGGKTVYSKVLEKINKVKGGIRNVDDACRKRETGSNSWLEHSWSLAIAPQVAKMW